MDDNDETLSKLKEFALRVIVSFEEPYLDHACWAVYVLDVDAMSRYVNEIAKKSY